MSYLDGVQWSRVECSPGSDDSLPHVTHEGVLEIAGNRLRVYRLSDGRDIINTDDFHQFFDDLLQP